MSESAGYYKVLPWWQVQLANILAAGPVPNHMAFILDGNRRWARERNMEVKAGHSRGAHSGEWIIKFLDALEVREVTMYAFSIENFNREEKEVDHLMKTLSESMDDFQKKMPRAKYRVIGDKLLLSEDMQKKIAKLESDTKDNPGIIINMAIAYTSRDDMTQAMKRVLQQKDSQFSTEEIAAEMYTNPLPAVDILLRTSGETRLSDYLLWETHKSWLCFVDKMWPDLNYWDMAKCILKYQRLCLTKAL